MSLIDKRTSYHRSHTLSNLPVSPQEAPPPETFNSSHSLEQANPPTPPIMSRSSAKSTSSSNHSRKSLEKPHRFSNESIKLPSKWKINTPPYKGRPKSLTRKISCNDFYHHPSFCSIPNPSKSSSSSSNLFSRVKDKIVETVYHTQDLPHWAAIVQEKRQRAADECEAKLAHSLSKEIRNQQTFETNNNNKKGHPLLPRLTDLKVHSSCDNSVITKRERARQGFRRRSISQDSYPQNILPKAGPLLSKKSSDGITCSSGDFQAIINDFSQFLKHQKVPLNQSNYKRLESLTKGNRTSARFNQEDFSSEASHHHHHHHHHSSSSSCEKGGPGLSRIVEMEVTMRDSIDNVEVEYDENGQTWGVYGAEIDPQILGNAIQIHLQRLIEHRVSIQSTEEVPPQNHKKAKREERRRMSIREKPCLVSKLFCFLNKK